MQDERLESRVFFPCALPIVFVHLEALGDHCSPLSLSLAVHLFFLLPGCFPPHCNAQAHNLGRYTLIHIPCPLGAPTQHLNHTIFPFNLAKCQIRDLCLPDSTTLPHCPFGSHSPLVTITLLSSRYISTHTMKRRRSEEQDEPPSPAHSSPSPESAHSHEGDIADNETDARGDGQHAGSSKRSFVPPDSSFIHSDGPPPAKKKRTRTLTTPHQSAVLYALLAQVRLIARGVSSQAQPVFRHPIVPFPDDSDARGGWPCDRVERAQGSGACSASRRHTHANVSSPGLVSGKSCSRSSPIYIPSNRGFDHQNQRQKARRPRNQGGQAAEQGTSGAVSLANLPGSSQPASTSSAAYPASASYGATTYGPPATSASVSRALYEADLALRNSGNTTSPTGLAGPGVPGPSTSHAASFAAGPSLPRLPPLSSSASAYGYPGRDLPPLTRRRSSSEHRARYSGPSESAQSPTETWVHAPHRDMAFNLPPLAIDDEPSIPRSISRLPPLDTSPFNYAAPAPRHWPEGEPLVQSPVAHFGPSSARRSRSRSPPYPLPGYGSLIHPTLPPLRVPSPSPHLQLRPLSATRPSTASWHTRSDEVLPSPLSAHFPRTRATSPAVPRATRFDPVRAAISDHDSPSRSSSPRRPTTGAVTPPKDALSATR